MTHNDDILLRALRREPTPRPAVWLMRQAGRYLPEYQEVRKKAGGFLAMCHSPELAAEVTLQPVRRFDVDGAVLFSDILLPLAAMGMELVFEDKRGPVFPKPLRTAADVDGLRAIDPSDDLGYVGDAIELVCAELPSHVTMLGFCGAPFTLASYAVEGGTSKGHAHVRSMMYREPEVFDRLMGKLADAVGTHLAFQIERGAQAVVIFDTWAGTLSREDWVTRCKPFTERALSHLPKGAPRMAFVLDGNHLADDVAAMDVDAMVVDWRMPIGEAFARFGDRLGLQGNLDPLLLLAPVDEVARRARAMAEQVGGRNGWVMSLGHGIVKETSPEAVAAFVKVAKETKNAS